MCWLLLLRVRAGRVAGGQKIREPSARRHNGSACNQTLQRKVAFVIEHGSSLDSFHGPA